MLGWIESRTGVGAALSALGAHAVPREPGWATAAERALLGVLAVQALSGLGLMTVYAPATQAAWASVHHLATAVPGGALLRGIHHFTSHALIVLLIIDLAVGVARRAYVAPREAAWLLRFGRVKLVLALAVTGHLLPWDQKGWWARRVELGILERVPVLGPPLRELVQGGSALGQLALTRAYAAHTAVLPILLTLVALAHLAVDRRARASQDRSGSPSAAAPAAAPPAAATSASASASSPWPQLARDAFAVLLLVVATAVALACHGAPLDAPADPASDYPARPEWFLAPMFLLRKLTSGPYEVLGTAIPPLLLAVFLAALPWIDRRPAPSARNGPLRRPPAFIVAPLLAALVFTVAAIAIVPRQGRRDATFKRAVARAEARASLAFELAKGGLPPGGPLELLRASPAARGEDLFARHCASCHVLGPLGDPAKATAPTLDRWSTEPWLRDLFHDPDADALFGRSPYATLMPSLELASKDRKPTDPPFVPTPADDLRALAAFLAAQGDEPTDDPPRPRAPAADLARGELLVRERCTACHFYRGEGDDNAQERAPELAGYGSLAWTRAQIANPATPATYRSKALDEELEKHMPRFDAELSARDLELLARYVRGRARGLNLR